MSRRQVYWLFGMVAAFLGLLITVQYRAVREWQQLPWVQQTRTLAVQVAEARQERETLKAQVEQARLRLDQAAVVPQLEERRQELIRARLLGGLTAVTGPGIEVTLNDSNVTVQPGENPNLYVLHDEDVLRVINELRAAGAEAIAINGQRLLATSEIRCIGPTILVNKNQRLTPPFVITAIGNQDNMINSLRMRGGVVEQLQFWGIQVGIRKIANAQVPAYPGGVRFEYARPLESEKREKG